MQFCIFFATVAQLIAIPACRPRQARAVGQGAAVAVAYFAVQAKPYSLHITWSLNSARMGRAGRPGKRLGRPVGGLFWQGL